MPVPLNPPAFWTIASTDIFHSANEYLPDDIPFIGIHKSPSLFALQKLDLYWMCMLHLVN